MTDRTIVSNELQRIDPVKYAHVTDNNWVSYGEMPNAPAGYKMFLGKEWRDAYLNSDMTADFVVSKDRILVCSCVSTPSLFKPELLFAEWLRLHVCALSASASGLFRREVLLTRNIVPRIIGKDVPKMPELWIRAYCALRNAFEYNCTSVNDNLPF